MRRQWGFQKPPVGSVLDRGDPINQGLVVRALGPTGLGLASARALTNNQTLYEGTAGRGLGRFGASSWAFDAVTEFVNVADNSKAAKAWVSAYPFTVSAWVKTSAANFYAFAMSDAASEVEFFFLALHGTRGVEAGNSAFPGDIFYASQGVAPTAGVWYHVAGTWHSTTDRRAYMNGRLVATNADTVATSFASLDNTTLGSVQRATPIYSAGNAENVGIWNRALTQTEMMRLYNEPFAGIAMPRLPAIANSVSQFSYMLAA